MNDYQVPDLIEPYYGYKWLRVDSSDGRLRSSHGYLPWPSNGPFVASCATDWGKEWVAVPTGTQQAKVVWDDRNEMTPKPGTGTIIVPGEAPRQFVGNPFDEDTRLKIILPRGYSWSWEPIPCPHEAPDESCTCGIYAVDSPKQCEGYSGYGSVLVKIAVWGKVITGTQGVRGQYAYPVEVVKEGRNTLGDKVRELYRMDMKKPEPVPQQEQSEAAKQLRRMSESYNKFQPVIRPETRSFRDRLGL